MSDPRQLSLLEAAAARDAGMAQVDDHADPEWRDAAYDALRRYLERHAEFFAADFWRDTDLPWPREARAFGPVVLRAARARWIVKTGEYRPSQHSHLGGMAVWRSLLYAGGDG